MKRESIDGDRIFVIHDFLSPRECRRHIERSEAIGYETFTIDGQVFHGYRDNARLMVDDAELAESLWQLAAEHLPPEIDSRPAAGFNPHFRYYRYTGSEAFAPHQDGSVRIGQRTSKLTFLVYLATIAKGGETRFYDEDLNIAHVVQPTVGKAIVFEHEIIHEGVAVDEGTKYVLRTDVMYG
ncbi:MAG: 2OG-Fe(II) oxygenase [Pirellulaceae bacterium]|nr:2OG-Fe(II) oxygenase [Pirellulaceae bacterium]